MSLEQIAAVPGGSSIPKSSLLGVLVMYAIPDKAVEHRRLSLLWRSEGLPGDRVPDEAEAINIFQRACRSVESRRGGPKSADKDTEVKVDRVVLRSPKCVYQVTRLTRDTQSEIITHQRDMTVRFDADTKAMSFDMTTAGDPEMQALADLIREFYADNAGLVPAPDVRTMVRDHLLNIGATSMRGRSGGVYFVPIDEVDTVTAMQTVLSDESIHGDDLVFSILPMLDNKNAKDIVRQQHDAGVQQDLTDLMAEVKQLLDDGKTINSRTLQKIALLKRQLTDRSKRYAEILGRESDVMDEKLELLNEAVYKLHQRGA